MSIEGCKDSGIAELVADRAYDANATLKACADAGLQVCTPSKSNREVPITYNKESFDMHRVVENFWEVIKRCRRVATRYDKLIETFSGFVHLAIAVQHLSGQTSESITFQTPP